MYLLPTSMTRQELWNEWHLELKIICSMLIASDNKRKTLIANGESVDSKGPDIMAMFKQHFKKVSVKQRSEMDDILGYEDMLDYAKWYVSGEDIVKN